MNNRRLILAKQSFSPPIVEINLRKQVLNVKDAYELPFKVTVDNKLRSFQFNIIHNIIPISLSKKHRNASTDSSKKKHLFMSLECPVVEPFWGDVITWWNTKRSDNINPYYSEIL